MNKKLIYTVFVLSVVAILGSCKDNNEPNWGSGGSTGTSVSLQASSPVTIGMETDYAALGAANYLQTAAANASQTTFGSAMTHGAVMQDDGTLNFTTPDAQMQAVKSAGIQNVWGKALCWYQSQNATYMNNAIGGTVIMPNLVTNGDFEDWSDASSAPPGWTYMNGAANFSQGTGANAEGNYSVAISGYGGALGSGQWHVQLGAAFPTVVGHIYNVTFDAMASSAGCYYQGEWDNTGSAQYTGDKPLTSSWVNYTFSFGKPMAASKDNTTITFDMAQNPAGSMVYIDNVVITDQTALDSITNAISTPEHKIEVVNDELTNWVTAMATHYKGQVVGWDVINELLADDGSIRTNANTSSPTATNWFVWSNYLGKDIGVKAFNLAHAADPSALLFINESGLESNSVKLDSLIAYVQWLKSQGTPIDGIGTSMHVNIATAKAGVDYMFQKLAATGLKIRISELDVSVNNKLSGFVLTPEVLSYQATTYHDVIASYLANVPAAQRQDITIWGVNDGNSWLYNGGMDYPLLFDDSFNTKPAFNGALQALQGK